MKVSATNQQAAVINFTEHCNWPALTFHLGPKRTHNTLAHICTPTSHRNTIIRLASIYTITLAVYHTITVARYHTAWQPQRGHRHCHLQSYGAIKDHTAHVAFHSLTLNDKTMYWSCGLWRNTPGKEELKQPSWIRCIFQEIALLFYYLDLH